MADIVTDKDRERARPIVDVLIATAHAPITWEHVIATALAEQRMRDAVLAHSHGDFCHREASFGGSPDLYERARGAWHIAATIRRGE